MDSIFEIQRQTHEEIERLERVLSTLLSRQASTQERKLQIEIKAAQILDRICARRTSLYNLYQDQEARKAEQDALSAPSQQNALSEFYARLAKIQEHHNKYPDAVPAGFDLEMAAFLDEPGQEDEEYEEEDRKYPALLN
jgi:splicing factor 3A subunit 3